MRNDWPWVDRPVFRMNDSFFTALSLETNTSPSIIRDSQSTNLKRYKACKSLLGILISLVGARGLFRVITKVSVVAFVHLGLERTVQITESFICTVRSHSNRRV